MPESSFGWFADLVRKVARLGGAIYLAGLLCSAATGVARTGNDGALAAVHKWTGHALVVFIWVSVPLSVGVILVRTLRRSPWFALAQTFALAALVGATPLASITGYLGPSSGERAEETIHRFVILHKFALPIIAAALAVGWLWFLRPPQRHVTHRNV